MLNKLKGKEAFKRKNKVMQPYSQLTSNCPQHKNRDKEEGQASRGEPTSRPISGSTFPVLYFFTPLAPSQGGIKEVSKGLSSLNAHV